MERFLVPLDLSSISTTVVDHAIRMARPTGASLRLLHVAAPDPELVGFKVGPQYVRDDLAEHLRRDHAALQEFAARCSEQGVTSDARMIQGPTAASILEEAERYAADLIIMGSHGRGGLAKLLIGSVAEQIIADSRRPVLVIPVRDELG